MAGLEGPSLCSGLWFCALSIHTQHYHERPVHGLHVERLWPHSATREQVHSEDFWGFKAITTNQSCHF